MADEIRYFRFKKLCFTSNIKTAEIYRYTCRKNSVGVLKYILVYLVYPPCSFLYSSKTYYPALEGTTIAKSYVFNVNVGWLLHRASMEVCFIYFAEVFS